MTTSLDPLNPPLHIREFSWSDIGFFVVADDELVGGTKQRLLSKIIKPLIKKGYTEFVYAGPTTGYAQIALAKVAQANRASGTIFVANERPINPLTQRAKNLGVHVYEGRPHEILKKTQDRAQEYASKKKSRYLFPFGLGLQYKEGAQRKQMYRRNYIAALRDAIKEATPKQLLENNPRRMWITVGSGVILQALYEVFPRTYFIAVQVGKKIWPEQIIKERTTIYRSKYNFFVPTEKPPPYPSLDRYDGKIWEIFMDKGEEGDYIWNVGRDEHPEENR